MSKAIAGCRYCHYKKDSMIYTVLADSAFDCENLKPLVVYRSEYETPDHPKGTIWVRAKADFESVVKLADGRIVERFTKVEE